MADRRCGLGYAELVQAGFALASVEYRVGLGAQYPALIDDALSAINFLREHGADYGIDNSRIALLGSSAGGYVVTMAALKDGGVHCVVDRYGVADLDLIGAGLDKVFEEVHHSPAATESILLNGPAFGASPGASVFETPEKTFAASPSSLISPAAPPFLIFHGSEDTTVSPVGLMTLYEELRAAGVEAQRYILEGAPHGGPMFASPEATELTVVSFGRRWECKLLHAGFPCEWLAWEGATTPIGL